MKNKTNAETRDSDVEKNRFGLNRIVTELKPNWFFPELVQEKMSVPFF